MKEFIYVIIILGLIIFIFATWLSTPKGKGFVGELIVKLIIGKTKEGKRYIINNYMLEDKGKSSQIDHILININGVFVIETKNYAGRIYGNEKQLEWTQVLAYGKVKHKLYNPIKQNATHIFRLKTILPKDVLIKSIIVFVKGNTKYIDSDIVLPLSKLKKALKEPLGDKLTIEQMKEIYNSLQEAKINCKVSNREHIKGIVQLKENIDNNICPRCEGKIIEKKGKYGVFYGCENYPKCRFIRK